MPNIASILKDEITRITRKQLRADTESLKSTSSKYRSDIAELKRQVTALQKQVAQLAKALSKSTRPAPKATEDVKVRFSAKGFKTRRERLGLSAADMGKLIGVSLQTIYNWETGKTRPRSDQVKIIAAIRKASKRQILDHLAAHS